MNLILKDRSFNNRNYEIDNDFFEQLEARGIKITEEQREQINNRLKNIITYEPRIGIFGKTGVGKSSLCNALFGKDICQISDVEACTRNTKEVMLDIGGNGIKLIDVPGVGENEYRDEEYADVYSKLLPELDLVLWVIKADDRALSIDETFYKNIVKLHINEGKPFFFVLNQVDKIEPYRDWDEKKHEPGIRQFQNIYRKIEDVSRVFDIATSKIIPISANEKYNLIKLVDEFIRALPKEKKITVFKAVNKEFHSKSTGEHIKKSIIEVIVENIKEVVISGLENGKEIVCKGLEVIGNVIESTGKFVWDCLPFKKWF